MLKRVLSFWDVTLLGIGLIIGAGIYVLIGEAWVISGDGLPFAFAIAGASALFTANSFAKLAVAFPGDESIYEYVKSCFGDDVGFLASWMTVMAVVSTSATVALGFGDYFSYFGVSQKLAAVVILLTVTLVNAIGVKTTTGINNVITVLESGGLIAIIGMAAWKGGWPSVEMTPGVLRATSIVFFAYLGFEAIVTAMEETKNAKKVIPRAIMTSVVVCSVLYVLTSLAFLSLGGRRSAPIASAAENAVGPLGGGLFAIIALMATANTLLLTFFQGSRLIYGSGKLLKMRVLRATQRDVPLNGLAIMFALSSAILTTDIVFAADTSDLLLLTVFVLVNLSALQLSREGEFSKKTGASALAGLLSSLLLISHIENWNAALLLTGVGALLKAMKKRNIIGDVVGKA